MPFKHRDAVRDKFPKAKYRVTNWAAYTESLRRRGDLTIWFDLEGCSGWRAGGPRRRGGQPVYSDLAIEICLTLRVVFGLPLRQTQGFARSILKLAGFSLPVPDFSTLCRRGRTLCVRQQKHPATGPITLVVDSTGLRIHGGRDWMREKHGTTNARKTWRKLHIGIDPARGDIIASHLTTGACRRPERPAEAIHANRRAGGVAPCR